MRRGRWKLGGGSFAVKESLRAPFQGLPNLSQHCVEA